MEYDVIFIGEEHQSRISHHAELAILKGLAERDSNLVLALEMFERDIQDVLDAYLTGKISEEQVESLQSHALFDSRISGKETPGYRVHYCPN
jgi:uncharacterized iron-regulated protein